MIDLHSIKLIEAIDYSVTLVICPELPTAKGLFKKELLLY